MDIPKDTNTIIGQNSIFEGTFKVDGKLAILGKFKGDLVFADEIYIDETGDIESNIRGGRIFVSGKVRGNIHGKDRVMLEPGSHIVGDITTPELLTRQGVILQGRCNITQGPQE